MDSLTKVRSDIVASFVIPCFNEAAGLEDLLEACRKAQFSEDTEIILVDNGSTDDTQTILKKIVGKEENIRVVRVSQNLGYGHGILMGLNEAKGNILGWTHADLQTNPLDMKKSLQYFRAVDKEPFVKGLRYGRPFGDVFFTVCMSLFETVLLRRFLWDINAQPTIFTRGFFETWREPPKDFSLDLFAYYMAKKNKLKVVRFKTHFGERKYGESSWNVDLKAKFKFIKRTLEFSFKLKKRLP